MDDKAIPIAQPATERNQQQDQKPNDSVATNSSKDGPSSPAIASDDAGNNIDRGAGTSISSSVDKNANGTLDRNIVVEKQQQQQQNESKTMTPSAAGTTRISSTVDIGTEDRNIVENQQQIESNPLSESAAGATSPTGKSRIVLDADQIVPEITPPKPPSKCPLFCVFYSVFDIKIGPTVAYQCPPNFMEQTIDISTNQVHDILAQTFEELRVKHVTDRQQQQESQQHGSQKKEDTGAAQQSDNEDTSQHQSDNS